MTAKAELKKENTELQKAEEPDIKTVRITAVDMFEKFADITRDIAERAFAFFRDRGGEFGKDLEDWLKAENEILRPVPVEITETDNQIMLTAAVPGFKPEEIEVSIKDNIVVINGKTETETENTDANTVLREWKSDRFFRQLMLPANVAPENVTAELADGMLKLTMPKAPMLEPTKIPVKTA